MRIAFIGLGAMGSLMATRLAGNPDVELTLYDADATRLAACSGLGRLATSVKDAAEGVDAVFSVVPADPNVEQVVAGLLETNQPVPWYVDFSTVSPSTIESVSARLAERGTRTMGAGMTKSLEGARTGTLVLFGGGPDEVPAELALPFDVLTEEVRMVGTAGAAKAFKLVNNMVVACLDVVICEALVLGRRVGIDAATVTNTLLAQGASSWPLEHHIIKHVLTDDLGPGYFSTRLLVKDLALYQAFAASMGLAAPFAGIASSFYRGTVAHGHSEDYHLIVVKWLTSGAGLDAARDLPTAHRYDLGAPDEWPTRIAAGVAAVQALASAEAIDTLGRMGVDPVAAAQHLEAGTAGNDTLRTFSTGNGWPTTEQLSIDLDRVLELAAEHYVPSTMLEVARHIVRSSTHGLTSLTIPAV